MKSFVVFALLVAAAVAAPPADSKDAETIVYDNTNIGTDGYEYRVETSNGLKSFESAVLENRGTENEGIEVRGQYSYPGPDGVLYEVTYTAGKNGFQPAGPHIPQ